MNFNCWDRLSGLLILLIVTGFVLSVPVDALGQRSDIWGTDIEQIKEKLEQHRDQVRQRSPVPSGIDVGSFGGNFPLFKQDQSWNRNPNPNPQLNFLIFQQGQPAGNVNGDSLNGNPMDDYIVTGLARNEKTTALEDSTYKTAVFYGGNTSGEPDDIIYRKLIPVGDLNGDGYSDALAVQTELSQSGPQYFYKGSANGYVKTNSSLSIDLTKNQVLGFQDVDNDGRDDILFYSRSSAEVFIARGLSNFSDITTSTLGQILSTQSKTIAVKDVDGDDLSEIVEFAGSLGDGQIRIVQINADLTTNLEQSFAYTSFSQSASDHDIHLIDITGDGFSEIFITLNKRDPDVWEYSSEAYNTTPTQFFNGQIVPVGDLNNDGNFDFIQGEPTEAHISYGPDDISTALTKDVTLSGNNSTNWEWAYRYNPYSRFGDFNGDGVDDALLEHFEIIENNPSFDRRIITGDGSESPSPSSSFHSYSFQNFFSAVYATENLGDINGDGKDDFAMIFSDLRKMEIYYGGDTISQKPDATLNTSYRIQGIATGDFTGNGATNFALVGVGMQQQALIEVFESGSSITSLTTINASDFQTLNGETVDLPRFAGLNRIGDVNNDGIDDFLVGSGAGRDTSGTVQYLQEAYIFYGGSSISSTPDETIDLDPSGDYTGQGIRAGERAAALGDIDRDGNDDFAVSSPQKPVGDRSGEVRVVLSSTDTPVLLSPDGTPFDFGDGLAAGDFNGDGIPDIAVSVISSFQTPPSMVQIFNGGSGFDRNVDRTLPLPDFSQGTNLGFNIGALEVIPDYNNDGKDELLLGSFFTNSDAAFYRFNGLDPATGSVSGVKAPNQAAGLGGRFKMATGNFVDDNQLELVLTQTLDNNDAFFSSRVYRYNLTAPLEITQVDDVPNDQGDTVRVNIAGSYLEASAQGTFSYDSVRVQRKLQEGGWKILKTILQFDGSTGSVDVPVPKTQPSGDVEVDYSYTFRTEIYQGETLIARSGQDTGKAFDNIVPPKVTGLSVSEQNGSKVISWQALDISDLEAYLIVREDDNGELLLIGNTDNTTFQLPDNLSGVQKLFVVGQDVNNNVSELSDPVNAIYPKTVNYNLTTGWSLVGIPLNVTASEVEAALVESTDLIYEYDGGYKLTEQPESGTGYWVKSSSQISNQLQGDPLTQFSIDLDQGWNIVSGVGGKLAVSSIDDPNGILVPGTTFAFDQAYISSDSLRPGNGYWVRASASGTITLTHPKLVTTQTKLINESTNTHSKSAKTIEQKFDKVIISDGERERKLFFGGQLPENTNNLRFSLPPLPPGDVFDARFGNNMRLVQKNEVQIKVETIEGTSLSLEIIPENLSEQSTFLVKEFADGKLLSEYKVDTDRGVELKHRETDTIFLSPVESSAFGQNQTPDEFKLKQNYPNPFNPTTQIEYSITEASNVTLEVFNILGRRVAMLVNTEKKPGTYQVTFDGSDLASGIYLYRLRAGSKVSTKKFILAK